MIDAKKVGTRTHASAISHQQMESNVRPLSQDAPGLMAQWVHGTYLWLLPHPGVREHKGRRGENAAVNHVREVHDGLVEGQVHEVQVHVQPREQHADQLESDPGGTMVEWGGDGMGPGVDQPQAQASSGERQLRETPCALALAHQVLVQEQGLS